MDIAQLGFCCSIPGTTGLLVWVSHAVPATGSSHVGPRSPNPSYPRHRLAWCCALPAHADRLCLYRGCTFWGPPTWRTRPCASSERRWRPGRSFCRDCTRARGLLPPRPNPGASAGGEPHSAGVCQGPCTRVTFARAIWSALRVVTQSRASAGVSVVPSPCAASLATARGQRGVRYTSRVSRGICFSIRAET